MTDTKSISPAERPLEQEKAPQLTLRRGHTTFLIGLHFKNAKTHTVTDKDQAFDPQGGEERRRIKQLLLSNRNSYTEMP
ncbi:MAG: hypothetical protein IJ091_10375 [Oscillospiraceae bacterium]|nr:hypothetical protein [Oscillospiraceae bacterium]